MTDAQLQTLKAELINDPLGRGYSGMTDVAAAERINEPDRQPDRESITGGMLGASIVRSEFAAISAAADRQYVAALVGANELPLTSNLKTELGSLFPQGSTTRANVLELLKRPGSRGEELGIGTVTPSDIANAKRLP